MGRLVYANNFENGVNDRFATGSDNGVNGGIATRGLTARWSLENTDTSPNGKYGRFLGRFGKDRDRVDLLLANLPPKSHVDLQFRLYIIHSWDGNDTAAGPDRWHVEVVDGPMLLDTTFANFPDARQAFPLNRGERDFSAGTGALEQDTLGYSVPGAVGDSVYQIGLSFPHEDRTLTLRFMSEGLEALDNESWGLDDVVVVITPTSEA
jgi:hypothetical protein